MKTICLLTILLTLASCGGDRGVTPSQAYIRMNVAGKSFSTDGMVTIGTSLTDGKYNLSIIGTDKTFEGEVSTFSLIFSTTTEITTGSYTIAALSGGASITPVNGKTYLQGSGPFTVQITETQGSGTARKFKGSFSGQLKGPTAGDAIAITEGEFSSL